MQRFITVAVFLILGACLSTVDAQSKSKISIPDDFVLTFGYGSSGAQTFYKISNDGYITYYLNSNMPETHRLPILLLGQGPKKPKLPKLKDKLSSKQIKQIISEVEKSGFLTLSQDGCGGNITSDGKTLYITFRSNGTTKTTTMDGYCEPIKGSDADMFQNLYRKLGESIKGIKYKRVSREEFFPT